MKNRKTALDHELKDSSNLVTKSFTEIRTKKRLPATKSLLEKSAHILQGYNNIFKKDLQLDHYGDSDSYFKKSLRNYGDIELQRTLIGKYNSEKRRSRQAGQGDFVKKVRGKKVLNKNNKSLPKTEVVVLKKSKETKLLEEEEEEEDEEAYLDVKESFDSPRSSFFETARLSEAMAEPPVELAVAPTAPTAPTAPSAPESVVDLTVGEPPAEKEKEGAEEEGAEEEDSDSDDLPSDTETFETMVLQVIEDLDEMEKEALKVAKDDDKGKPDRPDLPKDDNAIIKEVEECEAQCMEIYKILSELKQRVSELLNVSQRTAQEDQELEQKQKLLNEKMSLLEQKTRRIQLLVGQTKGKQDFNVPHEEDQLPKVVVCGLTGDNMPKFIICDDKKRREPTKRFNPTKPEKCSAPCSYPPMHPPECGVMPQIAKRLTESYNMQERLAKENADLEGNRYKLQEDLLTKDQTVESLQRQLTSIQSELRMVVKENGLLNSKLEKSQGYGPNSPRGQQQQSGCPAPCSRGQENRGKSAPCARFEDESPRGVCPAVPNLGEGDISKTRMPCGKGRGVCPAEEELEVTKTLEHQLLEMEQEVKAIQTELTSVRQERLHLEQHRRMMNPPPPPCPPVCAAPCNPSRPDGAALRELREQYNTLQDDYKGKLTEVAGLRADVDKLKSLSAAAEEMRKAADEKAKELEKILKDLHQDKKSLAGSKEALVELEQQLVVAKQRYRDAKDELEELRSLTEDQQGQIDDYRNKYLEAQQTVEEQRRQIDLMELENSRISEQVNLEIQRVKNQFQEKLQELTPLPDILKATQLKLQEAQQMHMMAERNNENLVHELQAYRDKAQAIANQMEEIRSDQQLGADEKMQLQKRIQDLEDKVNELTDENEKMQISINDMEDAVNDAERRAQEKLHEIAQLSAEVETVREESARQVARTKDRCETVRRSMQNNISDLERQLAQSRASARSAQKDRDEIRCKMQSQINNLNENFEDAQMRIRNLQGHVNFLKNSCTAVFPTTEIMVASGDECTCASKF